MKLFDREFQSIYEALAESISARAEDLILCDDGVYRTKSHIYEIDNIVELSIKNPNRYFIVNGNISVLNPNFANFRKPADEVERQEPNSHLSDAIKYFIKNMFKFSESHEQFEEKMERLREQLNDGIDPRNGEWTAPNTKLNDSWFDACKEASTSNEPKSWDEFRKKHRVNWKMPNIDEFAYNRYTQGDWGINERDIFWWNDPLSNIDFSYNSKSNGSNIADFRPDSE